jgi:hypothetical protein
MAAKKEPNALFCMPNVPSAKYLFRRCGNSIAIGLREPGLVGNFVYAAG